MGGIVTAFSKVFFHENDIICLALPASWYELKKVYIRVKFTPYTLGNTIITS